uniref:Zinc-hook domain-containing protein n=1 Tax=Heterorhabditis bacteriophora TaxID=37862 RepID=A0A1I7XMK1_HETBA
MDQRTYLIYIEDRDNCSAIRTDSIEKIQNLNTRIKEYNVIIRDTNEKLLKLDDYERKGELKRTELRLLTERLNGMRVTAYPGSEEDIRQELQRMEESSEYRYLETEKEQLLGKIQDTEKELLIMRKDRKSAEEQMVKFMSINMVRRDLLGEIDVLEMEIRSSFNLPQHGSFVGKINDLIAKRQEDLETLKTESLHQLESAQRSVDEAQAEYAKLMCELKTCSEMIDRGEMNIKEAEIKLNMRESSKEEFRFLAFFKYCHYSCKIIFQIDSLRLQYREAEKFEDLEKEIEKKRIETNEAHDRLADLIRKHKDGYVGVFGSMPAGPWSDKILSVANSTQIKLKEVEDNFKQAELEFDRTSQSLNQLEIEDEKTHNEIKELKQKIWDVSTNFCNLLLSLLHYSIFINRSVAVLLWMSLQHYQISVASYLLHVRSLHLLTRKRRNTISYRQELYESWGEETNKTSCCPLCERKFGNQAGANELTNKLMNLSRSLPDEIEFLSERVAKHEEQERKYSDALVYVEQLRKIEEEKITEIQNGISTLKRMATSNSVILKSKQEEFDKISLISKTIVKIQANMKRSTVIFPLQKSKYFVSKSELLRIS